MWLLRDYTLGLGHCSLSKQLRNSVLNSLNSAKVYIMEQHTAAELTFHNDGKQMIGGWQNKFSKFNHPKLIFVVVSSWVVQTNMLWKTRIGNTTMLSWTSLSTEWSIVWAQVAKWWITVCYLNFAFIALTNIFCWRSVLEALLKRGSKVVLTCSNEAAAYEEHKRLR